MHGGDSAGAEKYFKDLLSQPDLAPEIKLYSLVDLAGVYARQSQFDDAWTHIKLAESIALELEDKDVLAFIETTKIMMMAAFVGDGKPAIQRLEEIISRSKDNDMLGLAYAYLGIMYFTEDENEKALTLLKKSVEYMESDDEEYKPFLVLPTMLTSLIHNQSGNYAEALRFARRASSIAERSDTTFFLGRTKLLEGMAHRGLRQYKEARTALAESIKSLSQNQ